MNEKTQNCSGASHQDRHNHEENRRFWDLEIDTYVWVFWAKLKIKFSLKRQSVVDEKTLYAPVRHTKPWEIEVSEI